MEKVTWRLVGFAVYTNFQVLRNPFLFGEVIRRFFGFSVGLVCASRAVCICMRPSPCGRPEMTFTAKIIEISDENEYYKGANYAKSVENDDVKRHKP